VLSAICPHVLYRQRRHHQHNYKARRKYDFRQKNKGRKYVFDSDLISEVDRLSAEGGHRFDPSTRGLETGETVSSPPNPIGQDAGNAIFHELIALGFSATKLPDSRRSKSSPATSITVNVRPEGPQGEAKLRAQRKNTK